MITMRMRAIRFDDQRVVRAMDRATHQALSRAAAFIMVRARQSIGKRKRISKPGEPPSSHTGHLKRLIRFGYDRQARSAVIGPLAARSRVADVIEYGGRSRIRRPGRPTRSAYYKPRPFMRPARDAELPKFPELWRNKVRR